jgi:hypothetical protein
MVARQRFFAIGWLASLSPAAPEVAWQHVPQGLEPRWVTRGFCRFNELRSPAYLTQQFLPRAASWIMQQLPVGADSALPASISSGPPVRWLVPLPLCTTKFAALDPRLHLSVERPVYEMPETIIGTCSPICSGRRL